MIKKERGQKTYDSTEWKERARQLRVKPESQTLASSCCAASLCGAPVESKCTEDKVKEMLRTEVRKWQSGRAIQKILDDELGMMVYVCNPSYSGGGGRKITNSRPFWAKLARPYLKRIGGIHKRPWVSDLSKPCLHRYHWGPTRSP
jgi:hypothetical protein